MFDVNRNKDRITPAVWGALRVLKAEGHYPRICSPHHLKIGRYNFYPGRGTIVCDNEPPQPERGLPAFIDLLAAARPQSARPSSDTRELSPTLIDNDTDDFSLTLPEQA